MDKQLSGGPQEFDTPAFKVRGANVTPDRETGIGSWSEHDIKRALVDGLRPDGRQLAPIMPYGFYKIFAPGDLDAVVAYLRSVAPVRNKVSESVYKSPLHVDIPPGAEKPLSPTDLSNPSSAAFIK
jgi:hypothetical protein